MRKAELDSLSRFSRTSRLASKRDFQSVFANGRKTTHHFLTALYVPNDRSHARLGIIIAKHHVKQAVDRNRVRRVIRESFRHHQDLLKGLDIIILMRSQCGPSGNKKALRDDVDKLWQQLVKLFKPV